MVYHKATNKTNVRLMFGRFSEVKIMSALFVIQTIAEIIIAAALILGVIFEEKLIAFETVLARRIRAAIRRKRRAAASSKQAQQSRVSRPQQPKRSAAERGNYPRQRRLSADNAA